MCVFGSQVEDMWDLVKPEPTPEAFSSLLASSAKAPTLALPWDLGKHLQSCSNDGLQICTESLGCESSDLSLSEVEDSLPYVEEEELEDGCEEYRSSSPDSRTEDILEASASSKAFPPAIRPKNMKSFKKDGRFMLLQDPAFEASNVQRNSLYCYREKGRLIMKMQILETDALSEKRQTDEDADVSDVRNSSSNGQIGLSKDFLPGKALSSDGQKCISKDFLKKSSEVSVAEESEKSSKGDLSVPGRKEFFTSGPTTFQRYEIPGVVERLEVIRFCYLMKKWREISSLLEVLKRLQPVTFSRPFLDAIVLLLVFVYRCLRSPECEDQSPEKCDRRSLKINKEAQTGESCAHFARRLAELRLPPWGSQILRAS
eukprot:TRINITY_DN19768_c0_g1_i1.p1 TRINITY_DN19768_c0_g1~~TRINITY_DN19768_c0_g1_i1.p1  ORF type:complete len:372 (-),score=42.18 TRINITY_DN19768_c0_g1_i1:278-1393(-)